MAAWTSPTTEPPEGNIAAPVNTGATGQAKQGGLIVNTGGGINGLIVRYGNVGIGTTNPHARLEVNGNIIAADPITNNQVATKGYVDASGGESPYIDWNDCEVKTAAVIQTESRRMCCSDGYVLMTTTCYVRGTNESNHTGVCYLWSTNCLYIASEFYSKVTGSIKCCKYVTQ